MTDAPRLTVILPTRNRKEGFRRVLESLLLEKREHYPNLEIVVIDGRSTDGTMDVILEHEQDIVWRTQRSKGLYAALNEGLALATGDWVRMIADDDEYVTGVMAPLTEVMRKHPDALGVGGTSSYERTLADGSKITNDIGRRTGEITLSNCGDAPDHILFSHEAMFFRREPLVKAKGWDERFIVGADVDLSFRMLRLGGSFFVVPQEVLIVHRNNQSLTIRYPIRGLLEAFYSLLCARQWRLIGKACQRRCKQLLGKRRH